MARARGGGGEALPSGEPFDAWAGRFVMVSIRGWLNEVMMCGLNRLCGGSLGLCWVEALWRGELLEVVEAWGLLCGY